MLVSLLQPLNASSPMDVTLSGMLMLVGLLQLLNASFPMDVTAVRNAYTRQSVAIIERPIPDGCNRIRDHHIPTLPRILHQLTIFNPKVAHFPLCSFSFRSFSIQS